MLHILCPFFPDCSCLRLPPKVRLKIPGAPKGVPPPSAVGFLKFSLARAYSNTTGYTSVQKNDKSPAHIHRSYPSHIECLCPTRYRDRPCRCLSYPQNTGGSLTLPNRRASTPSDVPGSIHPLRHFYTDPRPNAVLVLQGNLDQPAGAELRDTTVYAWRGMHMHPVNFSASSPPGHLVRCHRPL